MKFAIKDNYKKIIYVILLYALLFVTFLFNIYATDDFTTRYDYGSVLGCLKSSIHMGNGRLLGNFILYVFGFEPLFRIVLKPMILTAIVLLCEYVFNIKELWLKMVVSLLIIIPSPGFFANCYISNPCFINYVAPLLNLLLCLAIIKLSKKSKSGKALLCIAIFVCATCAQLYSENTSVIFLILACSMLVYNAVNKKDCLMYWMLFGGALLGIIGMLIIPKLVSYVYTDMSGYRGFVFNIPFAVGVVAKFSDFFSTATLWILLFGALQIYLLKKEALNDKLFTVHVIIATTYPGLCLLYKFTRTPADKVISGLTLFLTIMLLLFFLNAAVIFMKFLKEKVSRFFSVLMLVLIGISVGMFMFININGYRVFYLPLFIFICLNLYFFNYLKNNYLDIQIILKRSKVKNSVCALLMCCFAIMLPLQIIQEYDVQVMRQEYVEEKILNGDKEIFLPKIPNKNLVRDIYMDFYNSYVMENYPDVKVYFVDIEDWEENDRYTMLQNSPLASITYAIEHLDYGNKKTSLIQKNT